MRVELTKQQARLLLPAIAVELRNEGKFIDEDEARALRVLMHKLDRQIKETADVD